MTASAGSTCGSSSPATAPRSSNEDEDGWGGGGPPAIEIFQRGQVVRVAAEDIDIGQGQRASALHILAVGVQHMRERFTRAVELQKFEKRSTKWLATDCPPDFAEAYLQRRGIWKLPVLRGIATAPILRSDGSVLDRPGFDLKTGIYYKPRGVIFPQVPTAPTREDALRALDFLKSTLLPTFDFVDDASRSVALSAIFSALLRNLMVTAPLHAFSAPVPGSGKSKLVNLASVLRSGHTAAVTTLGGGLEEAEKRLGAMLIAGDAIIAIDNIERPLGGELLNQLVTEPAANIRVLGLSEMVRIPNSALFCATGNNLKVRDDLVRRSLLCRVDPGTERPELREFETPDPVVTAFKERPQLVISVLTAAQAFFLAGCPNDVPALGSFPDWSRWARDCLIWLDEADPVATMEEIRSEEPWLAALAAVLHQWRMVIGDNAVSAREVVGRAEQIALSGGFSYPDFREALGAACGPRGLNVARLGQWLGKVKGRRAEGMRLEFMGKLHGNALSGLVQ